MFRRLCGSVKCNKNAQPPAPARTRFNNVKNYIIQFDPNYIKVGNGPGWPGAKVLRVDMYVNGKKAGYVDIAIKSSNAEIIWGETFKNFRGKQIGRILRALVTKAVVNIGKYNKVYQNGSNMEKRSEMRGKNPRPTSTWILQEQLGFKPNASAPNKTSIFKIGNNISLINKTLNNYKKGRIGPRAGR